MGPVIAAQMWWKFQEGGSLVYFCEGTECFANVSILYLMISNVLNFYIPMFAMCVLYYKIYQIARTQYLTRPTSAMLELKSADSPVSRPKSSRKSQALTSENRHENPAIEEQGHINVAVDVNNGPKFKRCGTMIEELDEDNDKNTTSQDMRHAVAVDERRAGKDEGNKDSNDIHEHHETENHECPENSGSIDCDKSLEDARITEGNDERDGSQNSEEKSIEKDIPQNEEPQQQDNQSRVKQEIPFVPLSEPVVNEDHENEKNSDPGQTLGQEDDCKKDDIAEDGNGDNNNDDDDDNDVDKKMKSEASMGPRHNDSTETHSRRDVSPEMQEDTSKMPSQDVLELDPGTTSTNIDSVNADNNSMTDYETHHAGHHARISYEMHDYLRRKLSGRTSTPLARWKT
ncbi:hypothetical protein AC249_AIPGENE1255 [Exaiptasia diaphana]|nr:hypothetical protein AC249_AIPGENE1255 [Exaiptasia diaphana]